MFAAWLDLLLLVLAANSAPVILTRCLGNSFACPIDGNTLFLDQRPVLGPSKTWRGLLGAITICSLLAPLLGYSLIIGALVGMTSMLGDLCSSFIKRRLKLPSSTRALLIDQLPEALLPAILLHHHFKLTAVDFIYLAITFFILELVLSKIFFHLGVRKHPY